MRYIPICLLLMLGACTSPENEQEAPEEAEVASREVTLTLEARPEAGAVVVAGTANLPDGALLLYDISTADGHAIFEGVVPVRGGRYEARVPVPPVLQPAGQEEPVEVSELEVWVSFQTVMVPGEEQPPELVERFGEIGERMEGPQVKDVGDMWRAEVLQRVTLPK